MELDKRIKTDIGPIGCFDLEFAKDFIGKECYFANKNMYFSDLNTCDKSILKKIEDTEYPFVTTNKSYSWIIPSEWVAIEKRGTRPFTMKEFLEHFKFGDIITYRDRESTSVVYKQMFIGTYTNDDYEVVSIGNEDFLINKLWENFEFLKNGIWFPFGI